MKLKFKVQPYQTNAVESVIDCFLGQVNHSGIRYRMDPGRDKKNPGARKLFPSEEDGIGFKNAEVLLTDAQLLANIHSVQRRQNLPLSDKLVSSAGCRINL